MTMQAEQTKVTCTLSTGQQVEITGYTLPGSSPLVAHRSVMVAVTQTGKAKLEAGRHWVITHRPTGAQLAPYKADTLAEALRKIEDLQSLDLSWQKVHPENMTTEEQQEILNLLTDRKPRAGIVT